jgi:hypothetical protein
MGPAAMPIVLWAAHFTVVYGFTALACARQWTGAVPWVVSAASIVALVALAVVAVPAGLRAARGPRFADFLALGLGGLAAIAVAWEASSILWVPGCV